MSAPSPYFANIQRLFQSVACLSAKLTRNFENFIAIIANRQLSILPFGFIPKWKLNLAGAGVCLDDRLLAADVVEILQEQRSPHLGGG